MTKHCSTIVPPTNFPSEFSTSGKRHNIRYQVTQSKIAPPKSASPTSDNSNIKLNKVSHLHAGCNITRK